ncbi:MAG: GNAT family N-acetyltransferase [Culicoidibacterales bacterium]
MIDYTQISTQYQVKRLLRADSEAVYELCATNPQYYHYLCEPLTYEGVIAGIESFPPGKEVSDKYFLGFYTQAGQLVAILDLIWQYPNQQTAYIGLLMTDKNYQNQQVSSQIIQELSVYLRQKEISRIRLGCIEANQQAKCFWQKNHFNDTGEQKEFLNYNVHILERKL